MPEDSQTVGERLITVEITQEHLATMLERLEKKVDENHQAVMKKLECIQCPSPRCNDHDTRMAKLEIYMYLIGSIAGIAFTGFVYWLFEQI